MKTNLAVVKHRGHVKSEPDTHSASQLPPNDQPNDQQTEMQGKTISASFLKAADFIGTDEKNRAYCMDTAEPCRTM